MLLCPFALAEGQVFETPDRGSSSRSESHISHAIVVGDSSAEEIEDRRSSERRRGRSTGRRGAVSAPHALGTPRNRSLEAGSRRALRRAARRAQNGASTQAASRADGVRTALRGALQLLRRKTRDAAQCQAYFAEQGVDLKAWLDEDVPPYIYPLEPGPEAHPQLCGWAQTGEPFDYLFVSRSCVEKTKGPRAKCALASLLLHEMGHLARRDVEDHEPPEFFAACRIGCIDPGQFH